MNDPLDNQYDVPFQLSVVDFAYQILDMQETIASQQRTIEHLKDIERKYDEMLRSGLNHQREMSAIMLKGALAGAFDKNNPANQLDNESE